MKLIKMKLFYENFVLSHKNSTMCYQQNIHIAGERKRKREREREIFYTNMTFGNQKAS